MSETVMIQCADGNLNFSIAHAVYTEGMSITGSPPGAGAPAQVPANQGWQIVQDPLGSSHYLIVNSVSSLCIGIGANVPNGANVTDDATDRNVALTLQVQEQINNNCQLWDFVPPTGGSGNMVPRRLGWVEMCLCG